MMEIESYEKNKWYLNKFTRAVFFFVGDTSALFISALLAYFSLAPFTSVERPFPLFQTVIIAVSILGGLALFRMYMIKWRYMGLRDLVRIIFGIMVGVAFSLMLLRGFSSAGDYEYVFTILVMLNAILIIGAFRISKRIYFEIFHPSRKESKHTIIFGAESEGEQILRDIIKNSQWNLSVHGIFDDRVMPGLLLHGTRILGGKNKMIDYLRFNEVDLLIVAFPELPKKKLRELIDEIRNIRPKLEIKVLPSFHSLTADSVGLQHVRDISIEDILGREPVKLDMKSIEASIAGRKVLVTGAGGSIGSELVRQCAALKPNKLVALDIDETELFHIQNEFKKNDTEVIPYVASVTDEYKMDLLLEQFQPDVIFHAAAYKHVPMMESFPEEAVKVNIGGTRLMAMLACRHDIDKFVLISTDKAVNPTNVMGATKRVAEEICMAYNGTASTKFVSVRFGNVLGSRGSVVPLFIEQIKNGGPVTVTDPEMRRYFMTIPEAVLLVMQAGSMGAGGEVFVLDMGEPVKILDMARELIRLHNLVPDEDIAITYTGLRPGEKLFEELLNAEEGVLETKHAEIFKAICSSRLTPDDMETKIDQIFNLLKSNNTESLRPFLQSIVPTYKFKTQKFAQTSREINQSIVVG